MQKSKTPKTLLVVAAAFPRLAILFTLLQFTGCGPAQTPQKEDDSETLLSDQNNQTELPTNPDGNLVMYVSNQSLEISPLHIEIRIDGRLAVKDSFEVKDSHNWQKYSFQVPIGEHTLTAVAQDRLAHLEKHFTVSEKLWIAVGFYYSLARKGGVKDGPVFTCDIRDSPIYFQ